jgi:hypothetical protein
MASAPILASKRVPYRTLKRWYMISSKTLPTTTD